MGKHADNVVKYFGGPLGIKPWDIGDRKVDGTRGVDRFQGIQKQSIRELVLTSADALCSDYFWERPAAKGNRYHPQVSCDEGGLVRHVWYACYWGAEMMRSMDEYAAGTSAYGSEPTKHHDAVLAALILHDMMKEGDPQKANLPERSGPDGRRLIAGCHGVDMAQAIRERVLKGVVSDREHAHILYGIAAHMGPWTVPSINQPNNVADDESRLVAQIVHAGDYAASRRCDNVMSWVSTGTVFPGEPSSESTQPSQQKQAA